MSVKLSTATWVRFLRNYGPIPTNDNMYDESIQRALRKHKISPITLPTHLLERLISNFKEVSPVSYIITGTAGDGKTYHCRAVWSALGGDTEIWNQDSKIKTLIIGENKLVVVKDLSELRDDESLSLITDFAQDIINPEAKTFYLFAANHGQLLDKLKSVPETDYLARVYKAIEDLLVTGSTRDIGIRLKLSDLSRSPSAEIAKKIIREITFHEGWEDCRSCKAASGNNICPIQENRQRLIGKGPDDPFMQRLTSLIELSERNGNHFPIRQLLILGVNSLLGHPDARDGLMTCSDVFKIQAKGTVDQASLYRNIFGENLGTRRAEKTDLFRKLNAFGIGEETNYLIDNLLVYGNADSAYATDYELLVLADSIYGATPAYVSAQKNYLENDDIRTRNNFISNLRAQRQRLFFTLPETKSKDYRIWDLTVFRHAGLYLSVAEKIISNDNVPREALRIVVLGLNRIFTGMLLQDYDKLVLTTSGSYSQSKGSPLLDKIISVPRENGEEISIIKDKGETDGYFSVSVQLIRGSELEPVVFQLSPMRFEFLCRVAEGALPSSFSLECNEDLLAFKAMLLNATNQCRKLNCDDVPTDDELVLSFVELSSNGRILPHRVILRG